MLEHLKRFALGIGVLVVSSCAAAGAMAFYSFVVAYPKFGMLALAWGVSAYPLGWMARGKK